MIVRILNEGQWELSDDAVAELNPLDDAVEQAVDRRRPGPAGRGAARLLEQVRSAGTRCRTTSCWTPT